MTINKKEKILEKHGKWLERKPGGERANLSYADLRDADLSYAEQLIKYFKKDLYYVLSNCTQEVCALREKLLAGQIKGTHYEGKCCCLVGSLALASQAKYKDYCQSHIPYYEPGTHNPSEQLFWQIREGDTPENNQFAKIALEVIDQVLGKIG